MKFSLKSFFWFMCFFISIWLFYSFYYKFQFCNENEQSFNDYFYQDNFLNSQQLNKNDNYENKSYKVKKHKLFTYNRNLPLIFVGGIPGSGLEFMRKLLDENPNIRCGDETEILTDLIFRRNEWTNSKIEKERLKHASMGDDVIDSAVIAFILELIMKQGKIANRICNKDPQIFTYVKYIKKLFPNVKFILMVRDPRATAVSIVERNLYVNGINSNEHKNVLSGLNRIMETFHQSCIDLTSNTCMQVNHEKLILQPESTMESVLKFLNVSLDLSTNDSNVYLKKLPSYRDRIGIDKEKIFSWYKKFPADLLKEMESLAPIYKKMGYDTLNMAPSYLSYKNILTL